MNRRLKQSRNHNQLPDDHGGARGARLEGLIREELNFLLSNEVTDPRLDGVMVTQVELAWDGSRARLWFARGGSESSKDPDDVEQVLAGAAGFLRARLCDALFLKRVPELRFRRDLAANDWESANEESY